MKTTHLFLINPILLQFIIYFFKFFILTSMRWQNRKDISQHDFKIFKGQHVISNPYHQYSDFVILSSWLVRNLSVPGNSQYLLIKFSYFRYNFLNDPHIISGQSFTNHLPCQGQVKRISRRPSKKKRFILSKIQSLRA